MKLSVVIADQNASSNAFVVWRGFEESIYKAAKFGYHGVELALGGADDIDVVQLDQLLMKNHLTLSCISTGLTYAQRGLYMTHPDKAMRDKIIHVFKGLVRLASTRGRMINVGRARGFVGQDQSCQQAEELFLHCMSEILPDAAEYGVTILIETINRYESNFLNSLDDAAVLLKKLNAKNVGIMADLFHMNIEDDKIDHSIIRNLEFVKYVHVADSNRMAPGMGHTDFAAILDALIFIGYDGWLSAELLPNSDADGIARAAVEYMFPLLKQKGVLT